MLTQGVPDTQGVTCAWRKVIEASPLDVHSRISVCTGKCMGRCREEKSCTHEEAVTGPGQECNCRVMANGGISPEEPYVVYISMANGPQLLIVEGYN